MEGSDGMEWKIREYSVIDSTNLEAKRLLERGEGAGLVLWAHHQTKGRGRFNRGWWSLPGKSLLVSLVFEGLGGFEATRLVSVAAVTAIVRGGGNGPLIKWPNDLVYSNRKVGGILSESFTTRGKSFVIVGLGINVSYLPEELDRSPHSSVTSLLVEERRFWDTRLLLSHLLKEIESRMKMDKAGLLTEYRTKLAFKGERISIRQPLKVLGEMETRDEELHGSMLGVDDHGHLLLERNGCVLKVAAGDLHAYP